MTHYFRLLCLVTLLICTNSLAQDKKNILNGKLVTRNGNLDGIVIANVTKETSVLSDKKGYFTIECQVLDTLKFISSNYIEYTYVINELDVKLNPVLFPLEPIFTMNSLDEIVITKIDSDALGITNKYTRRHTPAERQLKKATTGGGFIPVDPIVNYFTGRTGMLKKALSYEREGFRIDKFLNAVSAERLERHYRIPLDYVETFVYYAVAKQDIKDILNAKIVDVKYLEISLTPVVFEFMELISKEEN
ncbi:hypothetical protein LNQ81_03910 [Myroides sp. M-43]|uniref:hypothetical protein n=1 Tax=Myroides oncorhynchi TaxID=2893756 RepID=UPI001E347AA8|nr:hypothetical protein [Myroides oncorhynchi]MCC9041845.1 hypothetical protein [Myroides oncorhynchi]